MYEITKGDITIRTDSESEAMRAFRWLGNQPPPPAPTPVSDEVPVLEPMLPTLPNPLLTNDVAPAGAGAGGAPVAKVVALNPPEQQIIPVRTVLLEVLDVVLTFPEGITSKGISQLSGVTQSRVSHRLTKLKRLGLVESMQGSINWRATPLARRAKLVAS